MKRVILVGTGHAHARVLRDFAQRPLHGIELVLASSVVRAPYSGMMPGWLTGRHCWDECTIDFMSLVETAGGRLMQADACALDPNRRELTLDCGSRLGYDLLSLNVGSTLNPPVFEGTTVLPLRPLWRLRSQWETWCSALAALPDRALHIAAAGGGAAAVEMLLAAQQRLARIAPARRFSYRLYTRADRLLPGATRRASARLAALCQARGMELSFNVRIDEDNPIPSQKPDLLLWATGAQAHPWLRNSGLATDAAGFVRVDSSLRSISHANIFAAGDCAAFAEPLPKSGVYAVRQGPMLAANLRAALEGQAPRAYRPQGRAMALLNLGDGSAMGLWGPFSAEGKWIMNWKDRIDRRFIQRHTLIAVPAYSAIQGDPHA